MIRVNLLPTKKKKKKPTPIPGFIAATVIATVVVVIASVFVYYQTQSTINSLKTTKARNETRIKDLRARLKKLKNYEKLVVDVEKKKKIIIGLREKQSIPVKILDELSKLLPTGVWLTQLTYNGRNIRIVGSAFTNSDVVNYVNNLKRSKLFNSVFLAESLHKQMNVGKKRRLSIYNFKINMTVKG